VSGEDRIRTDHVKGSIDVTLIVDKMRENRPRWFRHKIRLEETKAAREVIKIKVEGKRGRTKKWWLDTII